MQRKLGFGLLWLVFVVYAFVFAPPNRPETMDLILQMSQGNWTGLNPLLIALFNLMGILPAMYGAFLFLDGRGQKIRAWPAAIAVFFLGAFALIPYLVFREPNIKFQGEKNWVLRCQDSRILGILLLIPAIALIYFGLTQGDWSDFVMLWHGDRFVHVMSLDFCILSCLFPALTIDDLARRGITQKWIFWATCIPLFGPLIYLCLRPQTLVQTTD